MRSGRIIGTGLAIALVAGLCALSTVADYPSWWTARNVVITDAPVTNDFGAVNLGQLKWFATNACAELEANLPGGAGTNLTEFVAEFAYSNNYAAVNVGQVKNVASKIYDRLIAEGLTNGYPWTEATTDDNDYAACNIGQLKYVFGFDLTVDSDSDELPDWMEWAIINADANDSLQTLSDVLPGDDFDGDGYLNIYEAKYVSGATSDDSIPTPSYWVDGSVSTSGTGTAASPFKTIQEGLDAATNAYDIVQVADGIYTGSGNTNLDFHGYTNTLASASGAYQCTIDCMIEGRGVAFTNSETRHTVLSGVTIKRGYSEESGGGIYCSNASPTVIGCVIRYCTADTKAGGIYARSSSTTRLVNCTFRGNEAPKGGGAYFDTDADALIERCLFVGNKATGSGSDGGAIYCYASGPRMESSTIVENTSKDDGAGIYCREGSTPLILNCTIADNTSGDKGAGICCSGSTAASSPTGVNCIVWGNVADEYAQIKTNSSGGSASFTYCCIQNWTDGGEGNIADNPKLIAYTYLLLTNSPCIEAGTSNGVLWDAEGDVRPCSTNWDIGMDEFTDSDGDGMGDAWELRYFSSLSHSATDNGDTDDLTDLEEYENGTAPTNGDSDDDGLSDSAEINTYDTDPWNTDTDGDCLGDGWEVAYSNATGALNPLLADSDGDGTDDDEEDYDNDGLTNVQEYRLGTDPTVADSDGDGVDDGDDPDPNNPPRISGAKALDPQPIIFSLGDVSDLPCEAYSLTLNGTNVVLGSGSNGIEYATNMLDRGHTYTLTISRTNHYDNIRLDDDFDYWCKVDGLGERHPYHENPPGTPDCEQYDPLTSTWPLPRTNWLTGVDFWLADSNAIMGNYDIFGAAADPPGGGPTKDYHSGKEAYLIIPEVNAWRVSTNGLFPAVDKAATNEAEILPYECQHKKLEWVFIDESGNDAGTNYLGCVVSTSTTDRISIVTVKNTRPYETYLTTYGKDPELTVRARLVEMPNVFDEVKIPYGCGVCSAGATACGTGTGNLSINSMHAELRLGFMDDGRRAGSLRVDSDTMSADLSTPSALDVDDACGELEVLEDADFILRQVKSDDSLANITTDGSYKYYVDFYLDEKVPGTKDKDGFYNLPAANDRLVRWVVENPDGASATNQLSFIRVVGEKTATNTFIEVNSNEWCLVRGNETRYETREETVNGDDTIVTLTVSNATGVVSSRRVVTREYSWGSAVANLTIDPDGLALTTTWEYYGSGSAQGCTGKVKKVVNPDGSWEAFAYNTTGLVTAVTNGWLDAGDDETTDVAVTEYGYNPHATETNGVHAYGPRTVTKKIKDQVVSKTFYAYTTDEDQRRVDIVKRCVSPTATYDSADNLVTKTTYAKSGDSWTKKVESPDGRLDTYDESTGAYDVTACEPGDYSFIEGSGDDKLTTVTHGTTDSPAGVANRTTRDMTIANVRGQTLLRSTLIYTGSGYETSSWEQVSLDSAGNATNTWYSDGTQRETVWGCCAKDRDIDRNGGVTVYVLDNLDRTDIVRKLGVTNATYGSQEEIWTKYWFDAEGRTLKQNRYVVGSGISLITTNTYDDAGRLISTIDPTELETTYSYSSDGLTNTVVSPGGLTNVTVKYKDGRTKYTEINGTRRTTYCYGVNDDGTQWTATYTGPDGVNSPMWVTNTVDMLGRTVREERPSFGSDEALTATYIYNAAGQLEKTTRTDSPGTLYVYDSLGRQTHTVIDEDGDDNVDYDGLDRITKSDSFYEEDAAGDWWQVSASAIYAQESSSAATTTSVQKVRLTGLSTNLTSEALAIDIHGNTNHTTSAVDRDAKLVTQTVDSWDSTNDAVTVTLNSRLVSTETKTGLEYTYTYDAIGRRISTVDPRIGSDCVHYDENNRIDYAYDAASNKTSYVYDSAGRRIVVSNALGKVTRHAYDAEGRRSRTWGDVPYPVKYVYDDYGRMTNMTTYRSGTAWTETTWPDPEPDGDETIWLYDEATGLLTNKVYDDGNGPAYSYTADGKLSQRVWARGVTNDCYYDELGQLTNIAYHGSATDISLVYDRLGRQTSVTDALGTRTFGYNGDLQLTAETNELGVLSRSHDAHGRNSGLTFGSDYSVAYRYSQLGRFSTIGWGSYTASYAYVQNSDLVAGYEIPTGGSTFSATRTFESDRNLIATVNNVWSSSNISVYAYQNDAVGRRTQRIDNASVTNAFEYNTRNELVDADMGTNDYSYVYDPIGNRTSHTNNAEVLSYLSNELNQYTNIADGVTNTPTYDLDGNMLTYGGWTFAWNGENRLVQASNSTTVVTFGYDYMGRRIWKAVGTDTNWFTYDGWAMIRETSGSTTNDYVYGPDLSGSMQGAGTIGGLLLANLDGTTVLYSYDANGNVTGLTGTDGSTVARYEYGPYGRTLLAEDTDSSGTVDDNMFRFSTKYTDDETELVYYGYRYYQPQTGRWPNRDPIGETGGVNLYGFVQNEPIRHADVKGLWRATTESAGKKRRVYVYEGGDSLDSLGQLLLLDTSESDKWAIPSGSGKAADGTPCRVSVPNTAYVDRGQFEWVGWMTRMWLRRVGDDYVSVFDSAGFKVVDSEISTGAEVDSHLSDDNVISYAYVGHGRDGMLVPAGLLGGLFGSTRGLFDPSSSRPDTPYGIRTMYLITCESADKHSTWDNNVSSRGWLTTVEGRISALNAMNWWRFRFRFVTTHGDNGMRTVYP